MIENYKLATNKVIFDDVFDKVLQRLIDLHNAVYFML